MPGAQLEETHDLAAAGKTDLKQGEVKLPGVDHEDAIQDSLLEKAEKQTGKAVESLRHNFAQKHEKGES